MFVFHIFWRVSLQEIRGRNHSGGKYRMSAFGIGVSHHCHMSSDVVFRVMIKWDQYHIPDWQDFCQVLLEKKMRQWTGSQYFHRSFCSLADFSQWADPRTHVDIYISSRWVLNVFVLKAFITNVQDFYLQQFAGEEITSYIYSTYWNRIIVV